MAFLPFTLLRNETKKKKYQITDERKKKEHKIKEDRWRGEKNEQQTRLQHPFWKLKKEVLFFDRMGDRWWRGE